MKSRMVLWSLLLALAMAALGCAGGQGGQPENAESAAATEAGPAGGSAQDEVQMAAAIAVEIEAAPDRAVEILESHGMTPDQWQELMYEIAQDPVKADAYAAAKQSAVP